MKRMFFAALCALAAVFTSCDPNQGGITTINVTVEIDESKLGDIKPEAYEVTFTNTSTTVATTAQTENGKATAAIVPGIYTVMAKSSVAENGTFYSITGAVKDLNLLTEGETIKIEVDMVKESQLIFKEIYYHGCSYETGEVAEDGTPSTNTYFRDQFYEIYNNSDEVAYADGLCICDTDFASYDYSLYYEFFFADGTKADDKEYMFAQIIWQLPGDGDDYPIQPGESFIIAQWATNHKAETLSKGGSPVDLTGAEFEAIEGENTLWNGIVITDGPAVNMKMAANAAGYAPPQWLTAVGGSNMVLYKPSTPLRQEDFLVNNDPDWVQNFVEIKIADILDAVQMIDDETRVKTLGMPEILDSGYIWCDGTYKGQSVSRKQDGTLANGSPKYADTNNTTDDFELQNKPEIRRNGAKVPSWNTWIK